jgi:3-isopropylmalate/(R)-2-methylmalate dehydratase small subunit
MSRSIVERILTDIPELEIDLENQTIRANDLQEHFHIESDKKRRLLEGLDDIALTMKSETAIDAFEKNSNTPSIFS